nr:hypothetical protein [uncultured Psychroserpens sp.]
MLTFNLTAIFSTKIILNSFFNQLKEFFKNRLLAVTTSNVVLQDIEVVSPITVTCIKSANIENAFDPNPTMDLIKWKLKKNLETLAFLAELESRYDIGLPKFREECKSIKIQVQQITVELAYKIANYK